MQLNLKNNKNMHFLHFLRTEFLVLNCLHRTLVHFQFPPFLYAQNTEFGQQ